MFDCLLYMVLSDINTRQKLPPTMAKHHRDMAITLVQNVIENKIGWGVYFRNQFNACSGWAQSWYSAPTVAPPAEFRSEDILRDWLQSTRDQHIHFFQNFTNNDQYFHSASARPIGAVNAVHQLRVFQCASTTRRGPKPWHVSGQMAYNYQQS